MLRALTSARVGDAAGNAAIAAGALDRPPHAATAVDANSVRSTAETVMIASRVLRGVLLDQLRLNMSFAPGKSKGHSCRLYAMGSFIAQSLVAQGDE
jgi:hypothetical protein